MRTPGDPLRHSQYGMVDDSVFDTDLTGAAILTEGFASHRSTAGASGEAATGLPIVGFDDCYEGVSGEGELGFEDFVTTGGKWGPSGQFGTSGGTVTWSIAGAGLTNATGQSFFNGTTVNLSNFLSFDFTSVLTQAFAAWSAVANINFVQVADGGGNMGSGPTAMIRVCGASIDGDSNVLARAFFPVGAGNAQNNPVSGDMVLDSGEIDFWNPSSLLGVVTHELGHSLGLNHTSVPNSLMNPIFNPAITTPQADDIAGMRNIYGASGAVVGSVSISDVTVVEGIGGLELATFTITRTGGTVPFSVNFATANGTAVAGDLPGAGDYLQAAGTLTFAPGENAKSISLGVWGDSAVEPDETFFVNLSGITNGGIIADGQGVGTILNDDGHRISINDVSIIEGDAGTRTAVFTVTRAGGTTPFSVNFATADNTAVAGSDYVATSGTLTFGTGVNTQTISVTINGDKAFEGNESFFVNLSAASNGVFISDSQGQGTIVNDDANKAVYDFNNDGHSDLLWQNVNGTPAIWLLDGVNEIGGTNLRNPDVSWHGVGAGDFNKDGKADILWQNNDGTPAIWFMDGFNEIGGANLRKVDPSWHAVAAADFNGDGKADVLWQNTNGTSAIWFMDGVNEIGGADLRAVDPSWHAVAAGDFNGDGKADILWQNNNGTPAIWFMDGINEIGGADLRAVDPSWHAVAAGDYNNDGKSDIVWQNDNGTPAVWFMNGTSEVGGVDLRNPGADWHLV